MAHTDKHVSMEMNIGIAECVTFTKVARPAKFSMLRIQVDILKETLVVEPKDDTWTLFSG